VAEGDGAGSFGLTGTETFSIAGITELHDGGTPRTVQVTTDTAVSSMPGVRIDTPAEAGYVRYGGILPYVLRTRLWRTVQR
jgi:aconitate hydratase